MIHRGTPAKITVVQLGDLNRPETENAIGLANLIQRAFQFHMYERKFPIRGARYRLPNGGFDLDTAVAAILKREQVPMPVVFLTSIPYSDRSRGHEEGEYYFGEFALGSNTSVNVVSTHLWSSLPGVRRLQPYLLLSFSTIALSLWGELEVHDETRGCVFDYCDDPIDIDRVLADAALCSDCRGHLNAALKAGQLNLSQWAAALRLLNRAAGVKQAFVVMPFRRDLDSAYTTIRTALEQSGWRVIRGDQIAHPRTITHAIVTAILSSDLVVAELTGSNPNVFYEVGFAHAAGCDVIMLTQEDRIPFDVTVERAVKYKRTKKGLAALKRQLRDLAGLT